jgi:TonB-dependent receptor
MILPRALLLATTGLGLIPAAAWAGDDAAQSGASTDIVVTGTRASVAKATQIKRAANQIIDTVSASEIGQLPDFNAGDALRRVTGVNTLTYQGEPRFVIVRGFNQGYNDVLVDGFSLAATDINMGMTTTNGRQISMEVLPANLASHIDVIKSATPETEGNFIGGLVNFVTPSAFDFAKPTLSLSVKGGEALDSKANGGNHFGGQAEVAGATRFGSDQQFGLYLSGTYWRRDINVAQEETGSTRNWYTNAGTVTTPYGGNGYAVPANRIYYNYRNKRERFGFQGRLDWHGESAKAYIASYYFNQRENSARYTTNAAVAATATDSNQTATTGTLSNVTQTQQLAAICGSGRSMASMGAAMWIWAAAGMPISAPAGRTVR